MDDAAQQEVPERAAGETGSRILPGLVLMALGALLVGLRAAWTAGAEAFVWRLWGLELASWAPGEARAIGRALAPGIAAPEAAPAWAAPVGWLLLLAAVLVGALVLAPAIARLVPLEPAEGPDEPAPTCGPGLRLASALGLALATGPWTLAFVVRRTALGADAYLDLSDLAFGLGIGALVLGLLVLRSRHTPATPKASGPGVSLLAAALLAALGPALLSGIYLDGEPLTNDGVAYRWQAELFAAGELEAPSTPMDAHFGARQLLPPPQSLDIDPPWTTWSGWTAKYPPGHSAVLAPGAALGWPRLWVFALAGLSVLLTWHLAWRLAAGLEPLLRRRLATGAAWVLATSPMVLGVEALWLSHGTSLPTGLVFCLCWLVAWDRASGEEPGSPWPAAVLAGVSISICLAARPLTALALALPLAWWTLVDMARNPVPRTPREAGRILDPNHPVEVLAGRAPLWPILRRPVVMTAALLGALPGLIAFGTVNDLITGDHARPVYALYAELLSPNDRWGIINLGTALEYTLYNAARLSPWLLGGLPGLVVLVLGWRRLSRGDDGRFTEAMPPRSGAQPLDLTWQVPLVFLVLYALHRFQGIPWVGPLYFVEALPFLALPAAAGVLFLARRLGHGGVAAPFLVCGALGLGLLHPHLALAGEKVAERTAPERAAGAWLEENAGERLLVLVPIDSPAREKQLPLPPPTFVSDPATGAVAPQRWPLLARDLGAASAGLWELLGRPPMLRWSHAEGRLVEVDEPAD